MDRQWHTKRSILPQGREPRPAHRAVRPVHRPQGPHDQRRVLILFLWRSHDTPGSRGCASDRPDPVGSASLAELFSQPRDAGLVWAQDYPHAYPRDGAEHLFENDRVSIWDVSWPAGHAVPLHVHPTDTVLVFLEGGTISTTQEDGTEDTTTYSENEIAFLPAGTAHTTRVVNGSPRVMFYELKD